MLLPVLWWFTDSSLDFLLGSHLNVQCERQGLYVQMCAILNSVGHLLQPQLDSNQTLHITTSSFGFCLQGSPQWIIQFHLLPSHQPTAYPLTPHPDTLSLVFPFFLLSGGSICSILLPTYSLSLLCLGTSHFSVASPTLS